MRRTALMSGLAGLAALIAGTGEAPTQGWGWGPPPPTPPAWRYRRSFDWCYEKAARLHQFEYTMQQDGRISKDEARIAAALRADLAASCGGGRWHPNRGWYYPGR